MEYVALLRGINVGGNNKVEMKRLKQVFEDAGMASVRTYINSGNVLFSSDSAAATVTRRLEKAIHEHFGFPVSVLLRDIDQMRSLVKAMPPDWRNDDKKKCDVIFLWPEVDRPEILEQLDFRPEFEDVRYTPGAVMWCLARENATKSRLPRIVGTPLYKQVTVRNCNTARKLLELMEK